MNAVDRERNNLTGRVRRYAGVGTSMAGVVARGASARLMARMTGNDVDRSKLASELTSALGGLKGPLMKVAQMLSTIPDAVPEEVATELAQLQQHAPPMGWLFVKRRMAAELGADWQSQFGAFEKTAIKAASLGQVHQAQDLNGRRLACKLQYPDMQSAVNADLNQLKLIMSIYQRYDKAIQTDGIYAEINARLREELDYTRERQSMALYHRILSPSPTVRVPEGIQSLSTGRLLTMSWVDGDPLLRFKGADQALRNHLARAMFTAWYVPFYHYGVIHGDPHLGNYSVFKDPAVPEGHGVNLLDFGCIRVFPARFVQGVLDLYFALHDDDEARAVYALESWGFTDLRRDVIDAMMIWAKFLYAPILYDGIRPISETHATNYGRETAAKVHKELRRVGGVRVPPEFVFMDRAAIGLGGVFLHLGAEVNWYQLFHGLIADFTPQTLAERQSAALDAVGHPAEV